MYNFNELKTAKRNAADTLKNAKKAYLAAKQDYQKVREDTAILMAGMLDDNGPMNTCELRKATGLDAATIRSLIAPESHYSNTRDIYKKGSVVAMVRRDKERVIRRFALMEEDGTVNPDITTTRINYVNKYSVH